MQRTSSTCQGVPTIRAPLLTVQTPHREQGAQRRPHVRVHKVSRRPQPQLWHNPRRAQHNETYQITGHTQERYGTPSHRNKAGRRSRGHRPPTPRQYQGPNTLTPKKDRRRGGPLAPISSVSALVTSIPPVHFPLPHVMLLKVFYTNIYPYILSLKITR